MPVCKYTCSCKVLLIKGVVKIRIAFGWFTPLKFSDHLSSTIRHFNSNTINLEVINTFYICLYNMRHMCVFLKCNRESGKQRSLLLYNNEFTFYIVHIFVHVVNRPLMCVCVCLQYVKKEVTSIPDELFILHLLITIYSADHNRPFSTHWRKPM